MAEHKSPEEKLLALIKGVKKAKPPDVPQASAVQPTRLNEGSGAEASAKRDTYLSRAFKSHFSRNILDPAFLRSLNRYLVVILALLAAYLLAELVFARPRNEIDKRRLAEAKARRPAASDVYAIPEEKDEYPEHAKRIAYKSIFDKSAGTGSGAGAAISTSEDISQAIGLVGILPGEEPQAVIEDKKEQKTYYLKKGESFNNFVIDDISRDRVVVDYNGKKITLSL